MTYIEIFELNKHSSEDDVQNCIRWIQENFLESKFVSISIIIKRTANQHIYVEELNEEHQIGQNGKVTESGKQDLLSLKKVTLVHKEKQQLQKVSINVSQHQNTGNKRNGKEKVEDEQKRESNESIKQQQNEQIKQQQQQQQNEQKIEQTRQDYEYFEELSETVKQAEQLFAEKQYERVEELQLKISQISKQLIEQQEEENYIAFTNSRQRDSFNSNEDQKDKVRDAKYLQLVTIQLSNYIKQGRCQLIQKKSDAAIQFFESGVEFYRNIKNKKLICQKFNQNVIVDIMLNPQLLQELFSSLADTYQNLYNYEKSIEHFQNALEIIERYPDQKVEGAKLKGNFYNFLGLAFYCIGNIQKAIDSFNESLQICLLLNGENDIQAANRMNNPNQIINDDQLQNFNDIFSLFPQTENISFQFITLKRI